MPWCGAMRLRMSGRYSVCVACRCRPLGQVEQGRSVMVVWEEWVRS